LELLGPLGCGIQTGAGTVINALRPKAGSSIAVFGSGSVGLSAIMAARLVGCGTIVAVDVHEERLALARELGATHTVQSEHATSAIRGWTRNRGLDYAIDTTANPAVIRTAVELLATPGTCAVLGLAPAGTSMSLDINLVGNGRTIRGVTEGESVPRVMIPTLIDLWQQGRFPFDRLIQKYAFSDINQAAADMKQGSTIKPVLVMG
jgi:aryl-alcohol dehydrogenase